MTTATPPPLTSEQRARVLAEAQRMRAAGQPEQARALLRVVLHRYPNEVQLWLQLALVAADRAEQRAALETVLQLDPANVLALRGMRRFAEPAPAAAALTPVAPPAALPPEPAPAPDITLEPVPALDHSGLQLRNALFALAGMLGMVIFLVLIYRWLTPAPRQAVAPTAALPAAGVTIAAPTALPALTPVPVTVVVTVVASPPPATPVPVTVVVTVVATPRPAQPSAGLARPGQVYQQGPWQATLLRPEHARVLSGAIGSLQPRGRFALVLLTVGRSGSSAPLPLDQIALVDSLGERYRPVPGASRSYLEAYGRGQYGDLSDDEPVPAQSNVSVPLIFDIPADAQPRAITFGGFGWQIDP